MKRVVVCGANGLIGSHMARRLSAEGYYVVGLSRSPWRHGDNPCDDYWTCDLRDQHFSIFQRADAVYQFACEVGGLGYISDRANDAAMLRNSTLIDLNVLEAVRHYQIPQIFFASSACVYNSNKRFYAESDAYPANPNNEFAWQKLFAERLYRSYADYGIDVKIGRIFNTYGIGMAWEGGREKSVAALCRKVAQAKDGDTISVWGNGQQTRSFTYVEDCIEGICRLMQTGYQMPINIGPQQEVSIADLIHAIAKVAGKQVFCSYERDKPSGVAKICSDNTLIRDALTWEPTTTIEEGLKIVYPWIEKQLALKQKAA